jgi:uncharacterized damage-inducible protein DinB
MATPLDLTRGLYDYHWWANRQLWDVASALGDGVRRELGAHFSFPTLKGMFAHLYAADWIWLERWLGRPTGKLPGEADFPTWAGLRERWDALEKEQRRFVEALRPEDVDRLVVYRNTEGTEFRVVLWRLLQHVPNHATHHRSEIATMLTMLSGSPPDTGINTHATTVAPPPRAG